MPPKGKLDNKALALRQAQLKKQAQERARQEEERRRAIQDARESEAAPIIQRVARGWRVRRALEQLYLLEDDVLQRPTPGTQALEALLPDRSQAGGDFDSATSGQPVNAAGSLLQTMGIGIQLQKRLNQVRASMRRGSTMPALTEGVPAVFASEDKEFFEQQNAAEEKCSRSESKSASDKGLKDGSATPPVVPSAGTGGTPRAGSAREQQQQQPAPSLSRQLSARKGARASVAAGDKGDEPSMTQKHSSKVSSRGPSKPGSAASGVSQKSTRVSSRNSSTPGTPAPQEPSIDDLTLAYRLSLVTTRDRRTQDYDAAQAILWLMGADRLFARDFQRIAVHHRLRRKNLHSRVKLRLTLVRPGESYSPTSPPASPTVSASKDAGDRAEGAQELTPEGWAQVTRTAWALRPWSDFTPSVVLTGSRPSCQQTSERLRVLSDDHDIDNTLLRVKQHPEAVVCPDLDGGDAPGSPTRAGAALSLCAFTTIDGIANSLARTENREDEPEDDSGLPPLPVVLLVASGVVSELLLSCLNAGLPPEQKTAALASGRLMGGDAVLLESPTLFRIVGDTEEDEVVKSASELWEEGLKRNQWRVCEHITGDGRQGFSPKSRSNRSFERSLEMPQVQFASTRDEWRSYCKEPLVLSQRDFERLTERAGSIYLPFDKAELGALRALVRPCK